MYCTVLTYSRVSKYITASLHHLNIKLISYLEVSEKMKRADGRKSLSVDSVGGSGGDEVMYSFCVGN